MTGYQSTDVDDDLLSWAAKRPAAARGESFSQALDKARLDKQCVAFARILKCDSGECSEWLTLEDFQSRGMTCQLQSVSARAREIRTFLQETYRGQIQHKRHPTIAGLYLYRFNPDYRVPKSVAK